MRACLACSAAEAAAKAASVAVADALVVALLGAALRCAETRLACVGALAESGPVGPALDS